MAIGGGIGGFGGGAPNIDFQTLGRGFSTVTMLDVIVAHSPAWFTLATGFAAGALLWLIPLALLGANSLLSWVASGRARDFSTWNIMMPPLAPLVAASGALGGVLAYLRRLSAKTKRYVTVGNMTVAFNTAFATVSGMLAAVWLAMSGSTAGIAVWLLGIGAPVMGFLVDGLWEMFHNRLIRLLGRPDMDALLSIEAENLLGMHPGLGHFELEDVSVTNGTAVVTGEWDTNETRERVRQALRCIHGIDRVNMRRAS